MTGSAASQTADLIAFAGRLADISATAILPHFRRNTAVDHKPGTGKFDPVTIADREAERVMRALIEAERPDHGIVGEEFTDKPASSPHTWVLDPIDGTRAFIMGMPLWGTLIGTLEDGVPVAGIMNQPFTGERFAGTAEQAVCRRDGEETILKTSATSSLGDALLASTSPEMFSRGREMEAFERVSGACRMTRYGGDCYAYCMLAAGQLDLVIETGLNAYDIVALIPIVQGAGGVVTTWDGGSAAGGGRIVAAANAELHQYALDCLSAR